MDRPTTRTEADARSSRLDPHEAFVLPSRRPALDLCRGATRAGAGTVGQTGPVLVTGDAGVGKTWLWRRLEAEASTSSRWVGIDLTPANDPHEFYRLIAHELGLIGPGSTAGPISRVEIVDGLAERQAGGERVALVVEEAQNLSLDVWEEVRVLANRLGRPGGFSAMMLVGLTSLALRFSTRPFAAIEARLASRVHLGPIDADEAKELLDRLHPGRDWSNDEVESLHRDALGNPRRMLRRVTPTAAPMIRPKVAEISTVKELAPIEATGRAVELPTPIASPTPLTGPSKPPIRFEENMIEVGWSPDDAPVETVDGGPARRPGPSSATEGGEEAVQDHYAALQAWREWSENQARRAQPSPDPAEDDPDPSDEVEDDDFELPTTPRVDRPTVRAEGEQKFAPFGQLFSRMAQAREPE